MTNTVEDMMEAIAARVKTPDEKQLNSVSKCVSRVTELMEQIEDASAFVSEMKKELFELQENVIPDLLLSAGVSNFITSDGVKVTVADYVSGSLPIKDEEKRKQALLWIEKVGASDIIKNEINIGLPKGKDNVAARVKDFLEEVGVDFEEDRGVHAMTLKAFARERMRRGEEIPLDLLGLQAGQRATITLPKNKG